MSPPSQKVVELVLFRLADGVSREQFLATVDAVSAWVAEQSGFITRELAHDAAGDRWIDLIWWRTRGDAEAAAELAMTSESCAPMFALIDMPSVQIAHGDSAIPPAVAR